VAVTAHADFTVRIWDQRQSGTQSLLMNFYPVGAQLYTVLSSHKDWVSSVVCHPTEQHIFLSTSYDKTVKIWDTRSAIPLQTLTPHTDKVLCGSWCMELFATGGADNVLHTHKMAQK
jgi:ribosome biogenesis protein YTM1